MEVATSFHTAFKDLSWAEGLDLGDESECPQVTQPEADINQFKYLWSDLIMPDQ